MENSLQQLIEKLKNTKIDKCQIDPSHKSTEFYIGVEKKNQFYFQVLCSECLEKLAENHEDTTTEKLEIFISNLAASVLNNHKNIFQNSVEMYHNFSASIVETSNSLFQISEQLKNNSQSLKGELQQEVDGNQYVARLTQFFDDIQQKIKTGESINSALKQLRAFFSLDESNMPNPITLNVIPYQKIGFRLGELYHVKFNQKNRGLAILQGLLAQQANPNSKLSWGIGVVSSLLPLIQALTDEINQYFYFVVNNKECHKDQWQEPLTTVNQKYLGLCDKLFHDFFCKINDFIYQKQKQEFFWKECKPCMEQLDELKSKIKNLGSRLEIQYFRSSVNIVVLCQILVEFDQFCQTYSQKCSNEKECKSQKEHSSFWSNLLDDSFYWFQNNCLNNLLIQSTEFANQYLNRIKKKPNDCKCAEFMQLLLDLCSELAKNVQCLDSFYPIMSKYLEKWQKIDF